MKLPKRTKPREASPGNFFYFELEMEPTHLSNGVTRSFHYDAILWEQTSSLLTFLPLQRIFELEWSELNLIWKFSKQEWDNIHDEALTLLLLCDPFKEHEHLC